MNNRINDKVFPSSISTITLAIAVLGLISSTTISSIFVFAQSQGIIGQITKGTVVHGDIKSAYLINGQVQNDNTLSNGQLVAANIKDAIIINADINAIENKTVATGTTSSIIPSLHQGTNHTAVQIRDGKINSAQIADGMITKGQMSGGKVAGGKVIGANITGADIKGAELKDVNLKEVHVKVGNNTAGIGEKIVEKIHSYGNILKKINPFK